MEFIVLLVVCFAVYWHRNALKDLQRRLTASELGQADLRAQLAALSRHIGFTPPAPELRPPVEPEAPRSEPEAPVEPVQPAPMSTPQSPVSVPSVTGPAVAPEPEPVFAAPEASLEERLGTRWAVWVGGVALAIGGLMLVRYSIEQGLVGPQMRIALGALLAIALAAAGDWMRRRDQQFDLPVVASAHIPSVLVSAATVVALGTTYAAHALYGFIGPTVAFGLLGAVALAAMAGAALYGPALAGVGLLGAFVVPALVSSDAPNPWPVVVYLGVVAAAAYALARVRHWLWLAAGAVLGGVVWSVLLIASDGSGGLDWMPAVMVHVVVQLALAAFFVGMEPNLGRSDAESEPDGIAHAALGALASMAVVVLLADAAEPTVPALFAVVVAGLLAVTAWSTPAAAGAMLMGGVVGLVAMVAWRGLDAPLPLAPPYMREPGEVLRLPAEIGTFLTFAMIVAPSLAAAAALRLYRGRTVHADTAGLYAAAALIPLAAFVLAYLRVTQFDHSISFALGGGVMAAAFAMAAEYSLRAEGEDRPYATRLGTGAMAAAAIAALALALTCGLDRGYLTVAFALAALGSAYVATRRDIPFLRYAVFGLGVVVLARVAYDPRIMGTSVGSTPILNWLLLGYGVPAASFAIAARLLRPRADDLAVRLSDALAVLFTALLVTFQIRHMLNAGDPMNPASGHLELGLQTTAGLGLSYVLSRLDLGRSNPVFRWASLAFGVIAAVVAFVGLGLVENPLFTREAIVGRSWFSSLALAYLLPGLMAVVLARAARGVRPAWYVETIAVLAVLLILAFVTLEVRHSFQGELIRWTRPTGGAEQWAYSVAWLVLGLLFLAYGVVFQSKPARIASAALVVLSVLKAFLFDLSGLTGLWRALSFISLGLVLIGIGLVYQRLVFQQAGPASPQPGPAR